VKNPVAPLSFLPCHTVTMSPPHLVTQSCRAMATFFEVALWGREPEYLETVAEEALREVQRLEQQLSFYRSDSDIRELNVRAADEPVYVEPRLFAVLERAKRLSEETGGAFDITVAPLIRAWGFQGDSGRIASDDDLAAAREQVGMDLVELNSENYSVRFAKPGVTIDLGAIGKGYAVEQAAEIIRDAEIPGALIHGGTSTVQAVGTQSDGTPWAVAIQDPTDSENRLAVVSLSDSALSVSAVHGKYFTEGEVRYGHVLDPRTGRPVMNALLAAVVCQSATDSDALSTALLVGGEQVIDALVPGRPDLKALLVVPSESGEFRLIAHGIEMNRASKGIDVGELRP